MNLAFLRTRKSTGGAWLRNREGWRYADGKWVVGNGGQGAGRDGMRGGSRAAQSRVKSGVQGARWSSGGMLGGVQGGMWSEVQGEMWREVRGGGWSEAQGGRRGWDVERSAGREARVEWEAEWKTMRCGVG